MTTLTPKQEQIAERAHQLYLESGCQHGGDLEHWLRAEKELGSQFFSPPAAPETKAAKKPAVKKAAAPAPAPAKKAAVKKAAVAPAKKAAKKKA